jgi:hypothetical protein
MEIWFNQNQSVDLLYHLRNLTMDLFGITAFSYDFHSLEGGFSVLTHTNTHTKHTHIKHTKHTKHTYTKHTKHTKHIKHTEHTH